MAHYCPYCGATCKCHDDTDHIIRDYGQAAFSCVHREECLWYPPDGQQETIE